MYYDLQKANTSIMEKYFNLPLFFTLLAFALALYFLMGVKMDKTATTATTTTPTVSATA